MTFGTLSLGPPSKRFVVTPLLRRNHFGQHNEVGRSIWRFEMGAQHRLSLSLTKRMAFYFLNLHERLRNHKGAISQGGGGSLIAVLANRFCSYRRRPIDCVMASGRGVATGRGVFVRGFALNRCVWSFVSQFFWLITVRSFSILFLYSQVSWLNSLNGAPTLGFVLRAPDGICPHICIVRR